MGVSTQLDYKEVGKCKYCHNAIGWTVSKRTGKKYPVNVDLYTYDNLTDSVMIDKSDFHRCKEREEAS